MTRSETELQGLLAQAEAMHFGETQTSAMEDVVRHADAGGYHRLAFEARRSLASAYSVDRQWDKAFPLFSRCLSDYDRRPDHYGPEQDWALREWYTSIVTSMAEFPEISLSQINGAFDDMERRFKAGGHSLRDVYASRRWVCQLIGEWDAEERYYRQWLAAGGPRPGDVWEFEAEIERLVLRGDDASISRALPLAAPVLTGQMTFTQTPTPIQCLMALPLARIGERDLAAAAYRQAIKAITDGLYRYEYSGMLLEFCALTGNEAEGLRDLRVRLSGLYTLSRPSGTMEYAASVAILCRELIAARQGTERFKIAGTKETTTPVVLYPQVHAIALETADRFDRRNGTTWQGDRVRARLASTSLAPAVPLTPTVRLRIRLPRVPPQMPAEQLVERAERHHSRDESGQAWQHLIAIGDPPPQLAPRVTQLKALLTYSNPEAGEWLQQAAIAHRDAGDHVRELVCLCWLGGWRYEHGDPDGGMDILNQAVKRLYGIGDHQPLAMAERLQAVKLRGHKGRVEGWEALLSALRHAQAAGDQTAAGTAALTAAKWRTADALVKWRSRDKEHRRDDYPAIALEAYKAAQSPRQVIKAMELIRQAHDRTSTPAKFTALVSAELSVLPADSSSELLGYLRYHRGCSLLHKGRPAQAVDDIAYSVAEMRSRNEVLPSKVYNFAFALKAAGRFSEAADELDEIIETLKFLREKDRLPEPDIDYNALLLVAQCRQEQGEHDLALREYDRLAAYAVKNGSNMRAAHALRQAAVMLKKLGRGEEAAQRFQESNDAATAGAASIRGILGRRKQA